MVAALQQQSDHSAEAKRQTLEQFATLPPETQTAFLKRTFEEPQLRTDPDLLHEAMKSTVENHVAAQHKQELAALLQLSPQLVPTGKQHEQEQQAALENLASVTQTAQVEVKQALERGETLEQVKAKVASADTVLQATVATVAQEHKEEKQREQVAVNDELHREKVGLTQPEQVGAHPLAHLVSGDLKAAIHSAMGGAQAAHDMAEIGPANAGKAANEGHGRG